LRSLARPLADPKMLATFRPTLERIRAEVATATSADGRKLNRLLDEILRGQEDDAAFILPADEWSERVAPAFDLIEPQTRERWATLLRHCATANGSAPTGKWLTAARTLRDALGAETFTRLAVEWIGAFRVSSGSPPAWGYEVNSSASRGCLPHEDNATLLRGLAWCCAAVEDAALAATLGDAAIAGYRKVARVGPRSARVAGACLYALKSMPGLYGAAQLERVRLSVKQPTYIKGIEKALDEAAQRAGLTRKDLEELTVPEFELDREGRRRMPIGPAVAVLEVVGTDVGLRWEDADGKPRKAEPAEVNGAHGEPFRAGSPPR